MGDTIIRGGTVVCDPAAPDGAMKRNGAVLVRGREIVQVGAFDELRSVAEGATVLGSENHVVVPGFVNAHHHGWGLTPFQLGVLDGLLEPWCIDIQRALRAIDSYYDTLWSDLQNIRSGVTTVLHSEFNRVAAGYHREVADKLRAHEDSGMRVGYALTFADQNSFVYQDDAAFLSSLPAVVRQRFERLGAKRDPDRRPDSIFALLRRLTGEYQSHSRISPMICPAAPQWCSDDLLRKIRTTATELAVPIHLHCLESPFQREYGLQVYGTGMVQHLHRLGFLDETVSLGHAVWLNEEEVRICAATGTSACHNASSNLRLRVGIMPAHRMLEEGMNVAIGIDGSGINDNEDMLQEMRLVSKLHRLVPCCPPPAPPLSLDILRMATVNGAKVLGLQDRIGVLAPHRAADIVAIDTNRIRRPYLHPDTDPIDTILYRASAADVDTVVIDGEVVLRDGRFTRVDEQHVADSLLEAVERAPSELEQEWAAAFDAIRPYVHQFWSAWTMRPTSPHYQINSSK
jgi:cytosine/adenosine deaminase-related metal-dependent hydrolase